LTNIQVALKMETNQGQIDCIEQFDPHIILTGDEIQYRTNVGKEKAELYIDIRKQINPKKK